MTNSAPITPARDVIHVTIGDHASQIVIGKNIASEQTAQPQPSVPSMPDLRPAPIQIVHDRMVEHYPTDDDIRRICGMIHLDTRRVHFDHCAANTCWSVIVEAAHQHRLPQLVSFALEEYPLDDYLTAAHTQLLLGERKA